MQKKKVEGKDDSRTRSILLAEGLEQERVVLWRGGGTPQVPRPALPFLDLPKQDATARTAIMAHVKQQSLGCV